MCPRVYQWLAERPELSPFDFDPDAEIPYPGESNFYQINAGPLFYRLNPRVNLADLVQGVDALLRQEGWVRSGDGVTFRSWRPGRRNRNTLRAATAAG